MSNLWILLMGSVVLMRIFQLHYPVPGSNSLSFSKCDAAHVLMKEKMDLWCMFWQMDDQRFIAYQYRWLYLS